MPGSISTISNGKRHLLLSARGKNTSSAASIRARESGRPGDRQRTLAPRQELRVEQEERQRAEMVAVQMRQDDAVDVADDRAPRALSATGEDAPQSTSKVAFAVSSQKQVLKRPPEPKASPRADDGQPHGQALALGRADTSACQRRTFAHVVRHRELGRLHEVDGDHAR